MQHEIIKQIRDDLQNISQLSPDVDFLLKKGTSRIELLHLLTKIYDVEKRVIVLEKHLTIPLIHK
jgi:hypothetical protein